jgi:hypothetical protein
VIGESDAAGEQHLMLVSAADDTSCILKQRTRNAVLDPRSPKLEEVAWFQKLEDPSDSSMMLPQKTSPAVTVLSALSRV